MQDIALEITPLKDWGLSKSEKSPLLFIAGVCSAETFNQTLDTALALQNSPISVFRAGVWKPRTRPGGFEGKGEEALRWLEEVKKQSGLKIATEVANAKQCELALKYNLDVLWIGARTTSSPFAVQEISEALKGTNIPVIIKNPISPDLNLWIGALERINKSGITKIGAMFRGFSLRIKNPIYRNVPLWEILIELKRIFPNLPTFCDPSHIAGNKTLIEPLCKQAIDMEIDGFMIETHISPKNALSDQKQQLSPKQTLKIIENLNIKEKTSKESLTIQKIELLRDKIDFIDSEIINLLSERMQTSKQIGDIKKEASLTILQSSRWEKVLKKNIEEGKNLNLDESFTKSIYEIIHCESIKKQS